MTDLKTQIITFLSAAQNPVPTLEIAKKIGLTTTREVNPFLYKLQTEGKVIKTAEDNGSKPRWSLRK